MQVAQGGERSGLWSRIFSTWLVGKLLALGLLAGGGWVLYQGAISPVPRLSQTVIVGAEIVSMDEVLAVLPAAGTNIFAVRTPRLERDIEAIPAVMRADVTLVLPWTIRVTIHERAPRVIWDAAGRRVLVDATGLVLADVAELRSDSLLRGPRPPLPSIHAPEGPIVTAGSRVDPIVVRNAELLAQELGEVGLSNARVEYYPSTGLTLQIPGAYQVMLGFGGDLSAKLAAYRAIRAHLERTRTSAQLVDVRFLERPYYR